MKKDVTVGVIGCGAIAPTHLSSYAQLPDVRVKTLCDLVDGRARRLAEQFHIPGWTPHAEDLFADPEIDLIDVCTDHAGHTPLVIRALDAGKNVVCEKCLSADSEGIRAMLEAHKRHPELIFSGIFQHRHEPTNRLLKQLIEQGAFGRILNAAVYVTVFRPDSYYRDNWHGTWEKEGGSVLITQAIHHLDILCYFLGEVEAVSAAFANLAHPGVIKTEDTMAILLRFRSGALATLTTTSGSASEPYRSGFILTGTAGYVEYPDFRPAYLRFSDPELRKKAEAAFSKCVLTEAPDSRKGHYGGGHPAQLKDVTEAVREHRTPYVSGEEASKTAFLVMKCYESARSGQWVRV